jgi:hypothetical protein
MPSGTSGRGGIGGEHPVLRRVRRRVSDPSKADWP